MIGTYKNEGIMTPAILANVIEWYEFSVYTFLAGTISQIFFDSENRMLALANTFLVFCLGYFVRPLGGIIFGYLSDTLSRKGSFKISLLLMAISTILIGFLPNYSSCGIAATGLLIILRIVQGIAAGGGLPSSLCYIYEFSRTARNNYFCSLISASSMFGVLAGSLVVYLLNFLFSNDEIVNWAWRLPFLSSIVLLPFLIRTRIIFPDVEKFNMDIGESYNSNNFAQVVRNNRKNFFIGFVLYSHVTICFYLLFAWMPTYLNIFLGINQETALLMNVCSIIVLILSTLITGFIAQNTKKIKLIAVSSIIIAVLSLPFFYLFYTRNIYLIYFSLINFAIVLGITDGVIFSTIAELFEPRFRGLLVGMCISIPAAIFGGLTPLLASYLIININDVLIPSVILILSGILCFLICNYKIQSTTGCVDYNTA